MKCPLCGEELTHMRNDLPFGPTYVHASGHPMCDEFEAEWKKD